MEQHSFKVISSSEKGVYRILDLTDTNLVGITEAFEFDDKVSMDLADLYNLEIEAGERLCSKVKGYCIYISFDKKNMTGVEPLMNDYNRGVLNQMAEFFLNNVIKNNRDSFLEYTDINESLDSIEPSVEPVFSNEIKSNKPTTINSTPYVDKKEDEKAEDIDNSSKGTKRKEIPVWLRIVLAVGIIAFVVFLFDYIWFVIIFALCAIAFIPEALKR